MKILFVIAHIGKGGGQVTQSIRLIKELSKNHETKLLTLRYDSDIVDEPCETIYAGSLRYPKGVFDLWKKLREIKNYFDVIQCFDSFYALPAVWLSGHRKFFLRLGLSAKGEFKGRGHHFLANFANIKLFPLLFSSGFVVNSKALQKEMAAFHPQFIPNGYNLNGYINKSILTRKKLNLPKDKFIIIYTGKIIKRKNLGILFEVLRELDNTVLLLVGNINEQRYGDSYYSELKNQYSDVFDKVITPGEVHMDLVKNYLDAADAFVFPSLIEGSPNSVLEAMAAGLPVLCSDILPHREIINHMHNGIIFKTKTDLKKQLTKLKQDISLSRKLGLSAQDFVRKNHDIKTIAKKYIELYTRALK